MVQFASGEEHCHLLSITKQRHAEYCERHGIAYHLGDDAVEDGRTKHWRKISLMQEMAEQGYDKILWLDADCIIVDMSVNVMDVAGYGVAVCECFDSPDIIRHLNTGVILCTNSEAVRAFLRMWNSTPRPPGAIWADQSVFIALMEARPYRELLTILPNRFNCVERHMEASNPVIRHFAGDHDRIRKMRAIAGLD